MRGLAAGGDGRGFIFEEARRDGVFGGGLDFFYEKWLHLWSRRRVGEHFQKGFLFQG